MNTILNSISPLLSNRSFDRNVFKATVNHFKPSIVIKNIKFCSTFPSSSMTTLHRKYSTREERRQRREQSTTYKDTHGTSVTPHVENKIKSDESAQNFIYESYYNDEFATGEDRLNKSVLIHLRKVYNSMGIMTGIAAVSATIGILLPSAIAGPLGVFSLLASFGTILGIAFTDKSKVVLRQNLLWATGTLLGFGLVPVLAASTFATILMAFAGTSAIFAGFSFAAFKAKSTTFLKMGGVLIGAFFALIGVSLISLIGPALGLSAAAAAAFHSVNLWGGLFIFSLFIAYDTQRMIQSAYYGNSDHVSDALSIFLNVYQVFIRLLGSTIFKKIINIQKN